MSDDDEVDPPDPPGVPAWVMTFADLMSLLMCFFVLLLSFSQMDVLKFKKLAGSMEKAFGVQRDIVTYEIPKGTSIIAKEFTPGTPEPTPLKSMRQQTVRELFQTLYFNRISSKGKQFSGGKGGEAGTGGAEGSGGGKGNIGAAAILAEIKKHGTEAEQLGGAKEGEENEDKQADRDFIGLPAEKPGEEENAEEASAAAEEEALSMEIMMALLEVIQEAEEQAKDDILQEAMEQAKEAAHEQVGASEITAVKTAANIANILEDEINRGMVDIEVWDMRVVIRMAESGSFERGGARLKRDFIPVLDRLRSVFSKMTGEIHIMGHTDNVPVQTARFRSNWDLSSARAATVAHELLMDEELDPVRIKIIGMAHTHPLVPNTSEANRETNRRIELMLVQGDEPVYSQEVVKGLEGVLEVQQELTALEAAGDSLDDFGDLDDFGAHELTQEEIEELDREHMERELREQEEF